MKVLDNENNRAQARRPTTAVTGIDRSADWPAVNCWLIKSSSVHPEGDVLVEECQ